MTNDGVNVYVWDDADRLIEVREEAGPVRMRCRYDGLGRRRERVFWTEGVGSTNRYIYDGWLVAAITDGSTNVLERHVHGPDLSGAREGAGGIGGILSVQNRNAESGTWDSAFFHYDGNGNVMAVTDTNQTIASFFEYGPFGTLLIESDNLHVRYRYSSKEYDQTVGLYYYGFRYYSPNLGRWISRDPIGEGIKLNLTKNRDRRGIEYDFSRLEPNLYRFVRNNALLFLDALGLKVENNCSNPICVKPENGTEPIVLQPGDSYDGKVDGVSDCNGDVVKITDPYNDADIAVGSNGVNLPGPDFIGSEKLKCPPDDGWKPLFNCAKGNK